MNRRILLLSVVLLALAASLGWLLRQKYTTAHAHEQQVLSKPPNVRPIAPPPTPPPAAPVSPADYVEVAQKTLFSQDRNPDVIVEAPPPPKPEPPMPALPVYWGQMAFGGDPVAILTVGPAGEQKRFHVGEKVGDFKLMAFDRESMTLDWNGKQVERKLLELAPKEGQQPPAAASAAAAPAAPSQQLTSITSAAPQTSNAPPAVGTDMGGGFRACTGDSSPAGTVVQGYKKVIGQSLMGPTCHWELVK